MKGVFAVAVFLLPVSVAVATPEDQTELLLIEVSKQLKGLHEDHKAIATTLDAMKDSHVKLDKSITDLNARIEFATWALGCIGVGLLGVLVWGFNSINQLQQRAARIDGAVREIKDFVKPVFDQLISSSIKTGSKIVSP